MDIPLQEFFLFLDNRPEYVQEHSQPQILAISFEKLYSPQLLESFDVNLDTLWDMHSKFSDIHIIMVTVDNGVDLARKALEYLGKADQTSVELRIIL